MQFADIKQFGLLAAGSSVRCLSCRNVYNFLLWVYLDLKKLFVRCQPIEITNQFVTVAGVKITQGGSAGRQVNLVYSKKIIGM
jgi:hypothetical protein